MTFILAASLGFLADSEAEMKFLQNAAFALPSLILRRPKRDLNRFFCDLEIAISYHYDYTACLVFNGNYNQVYS